LHCYLNGEFLPTAEARVPVLDRGFLFGDGVYEVIPVYGRRPFRLDAHLRRLQRSLDALRMDPPHDHAHWRSLIAELVARQPFDDQGIYLQVTRGVAKRDHAFPKDVAPTVFMMGNPLVTPTAPQLAQGVAAITAADNRWLRCDIKSTALLANVLLRQMAVDQGAAETILLREGQLTEGSASNVFIVAGGVIASPPNGPLLLPGVTAEVVEDAARLEGVPLERRPVSEEQLRGADEVWITSASREVLAVSALDGSPVGNGRPGPIFARIHQRFQALKQADDAP
jgi:D-alanine transaminase